MRGDSYQLQGQQGGKVVTSADGAVTGPFREIRVVNAAVMSAFAGNLTGGDSKLITITLPAGLVLGGRITGFTLSSGVVVAYDG